MARRLSTAEVCARLGVKPGTVYAYVSRGLLDRRRDAGGSTFDAADVERLAQGSRRRTPERPMAWVTELTLIEDGHLWYRGVDAVALAGERSFEEVAEWLWTASWPPAPPRWAVPDGQRRAVADVLAALPRTGSALDRFTVAVAAAATADPLRHDLSPAAVAGVGRHVLTLLADDLARSSRRRGGTIADRVLAGVSPLPSTPGRVAAIGAALVLLADHELAASTLAARTAAAFGADPYAVVGAGLGAAAGARHAAASAEVHALFDDAGRVGAAAAVGERIRRNGAVPGHGQVLYPGGDPRGAALLDLLPSLGADRDRLEVVDGVLAVVADRAIPPPNVDFGLAALAYLLETPRWAGEAIFVLARTAGWLAHAIEAQGEGELFRVRATYTGPRPGPDPG